MWTKPPRLDETTGLSKYQSAGVGIPTEDEPGHFGTFIRPFTRRHGMIVAEFTTFYSLDRISEPELLRYLHHDRGARGSGHDTSSRLKGRTAELAITDSNVLLYKYETDKAFVIKEIFSGKFDIRSEFILPTSHEDSLASMWEAKTAKQKAAIHKYLD